MSKYRQALIGDWKKNFLDLAFRGDKFAMKILSTVGSKQSFDYILIRSLVFKKEMDDEKAMDNPLRPSTKEKHSGNNS